MDLDRGPAESGLSRFDLVAAAGVGIMSLDSAGRIASANVAATEILRCAEPDLIGRGAHEVLNADRPSGDCELETSARTGVAGHDDDDTFHRADGSLVPVWWGTNPLRDPRTGELVGAVLVFGDTTAQRARAVADAAERDQRRADLAEARQNVADLEWIDGIAQTLSSTLDEREVLERLARLAVSRLADVAVTSLFTDRGVERVGRAVAEGVSAQIAQALDAAELHGSFEDLAASLRAVDSDAAVHIPVESFGDGVTLSPQTAAVLSTVGATDLIAARLIARGRVVGALGLMRVDGSPRFSDVDVLFAGDLAHRAALAADNARLYRAQTEISSRLQQALLPSLPADLPIGAAVRYLPARDRFEVGGDWYDAFRLPDDTIALVIGDVAGHDLGAGTAMSALRNLLRGIIVATDEAPHRVLQSVDEHMSALGVTGTATVLLMTVAPRPDGLWDIAWSNAGHMPPLLLMPDGEVSLLHAVHGTLLGTELPQRRTQSSRTVPAGSTLVLYTDGLVETRDATIDAGLVHLRRTAMTLESARDDPDAVADELLARNHASSEDDTAMLVCHLPTTIRS